jgi:3-polyprenyl-4-hydroxybenzoate decarboxylase
VGASPGVECWTRAGTAGLAGVLAFSHRPATIEDLRGQTGGTVLDQFGIEHNTFTCWSTPA